MQTIDNIKSEFFITNPTKKAEQFRKKQDTTSWTGHTEDVTEPEIVEGVSDAVQAEIYLFAVGGVTQTL